jgi:O-6-methylguanine DNA methyltransferase
MLDLVGTPFQQRAWLALTEIPYGETRTYAEQADRLGLPRGARAIGSANARNPLPIVIPCHRLVGSKGALTGYAGGLGRKEDLLRLEGAPITGARIAWAHDAAASLASGDGGDGTSRRPRRDRHAV